MALKAYGKRACTIALLIVPLISSCSTTEIEANPTLPNIVLIVTDDQGYADVSFNGGSEIQTPNIDRIADEGVRFERGYVSSPVCGPSRAGLLTGRYQSRFGFDWNPPLNPGDASAGLPLEETMISEHLKQRDYKTMIVGKWHMGTHPSLRPLKRGFDEFYGFVSGGHNYFPEDINLDDIANSKKVGDWYHTRLRHNDGYHDLTQYLTDELSDQAVAFVERNQQQPFFLYLAYNAPHTPLQATQKYLDRFKHIKNEDRRTYAAMISAVDDGVGRLLNTLDESKIADNTIVIFLSDNGGKTVKKPGDKLYADNSPLRGGKGQLYEGGIRVPFAIRWPSKIESGLSYPQPVISLDILATLAQHLDIQIPSERPLDGVDLLPYLNGELDTAPHSALFWRRLKASDKAVVAGNKKYLSTNKGVKLFNVDDDLSESKNRLKTNKVLADELLESYQEWNSHMATEPAFGTRTSWPKGEN